MLLRDFKFDKNNLEEILIQIKDIIRPNYIYMLVGDTFKEDVNFCLKFDSKIEKIFECSEILYPSNLTSNSSIDVEYEFIEESHYFYESSSDFEVVFRVFNKNFYPNEIIGFIIFCFDDSQNKNEIDFASCKLLIDFLKESLNTIYFAQENRIRFDHQLEMLVETIQREISSLPYHLSGVANLALKIANEMELSLTSSRQLYIAALLHDVGKSYIPSEIINKKTKLENWEYEEIKKNPVYGYKIAKALVRGMPSLKNIPNYILHHAERFDGNGYPDRLYGNDIPFASQVVCICDAVDSMMSRKPYGYMKSLEQVLFELQRNSGKQFSPDLVKIMIKILTNKESNAQLNISDVNFIPYVALNIYYENTNSVRNLEGVVILDEKENKFIAHKTNVLEDIHLFNIKKSKLNFFQQGKNIEYNINLLKVSDNTVFFDKMEFLPDDSFFSIYWNIDAKAYFNQMDYELSVVRVGAESLSAKCKLDDPLFLFLKNKISTPGIIEIRFEVEPLIEDMQLECTFFEYSIFEGEVLMKFDYKEISARKKDELFRILFKKQIKEKQELNQKNQQ